MKIYLATGNRHKLDELAPMFPEHQIVLPSDEGIPFAFEENGTTYFCDPELEGVVSIVDVEVSHDNSFAKVIYSVLGSDEQVEKTKEIIEKSTPKVRYEIGKRIRLRLTPELKFVYTDSLEKGSKVSEIIDKISRGEL